MHRVPFDKKAMQERQRHAKCVRQQDRTRCRAEKHGGRAGPPDCVEVDAGAEEDAGGEEDVGGEEHAGAEVQERERQEDSAGGWDIVGRDEHVHSPPSCRPPCTSRTPARCTVS